MGELGDSEEVGAGILRLLGTLEYERNANVGQGDAAFCFSCGAVNAAGEVELTRNKLEVFLRALLVNEEDEEEICKRMKHPVRVCGACDKFLDTLIDRNQQLEDIRLEFCGVRRRVGRQMVLGPLGRLQESYVNWLRKVESVEDVFPSEVRKRLKKTCNVAVGTDEVVKIEEEEEVFDIIACNVETETFERNEVDESLKIGDLGGDNAAGPTDEHLSGRNVSLEWTKKSGVLAEKGCKETKDSQPTKRRRLRRSSVSKVEVVRPNLSQIDTVEPARGNRTKSDVKRVEGSPESHPSGLGTSTGDKTTVTSGGVSCDSLQTQTVGRPRRAIKKRVRYGEWLNEGGTCDGSAEKEDSEFLPSGDKIVSDADEFEEVGGTGQPETSVACKLLAISRCVIQRQPKKSTGGSYYQPRCKFCPKVFKGYSTMRRHCYLDHKEDYLKDLPFACLVCYHVFSSAMALQVHQNKHESLQCPICGRFLLIKRDLIEHMRTHTGVKPYACDVCDRKFSREKHLKVHMMTHSGEKPYACNICDRKFAHSGNLTVHMRTHSGEQPYACNVCDQKFSRKLNLKEHMNTHTEEKRYVCSCGEYFRWMSVIKRHKRTMGHS